MPGGKRKAQSAVTRTKAEPAAKKKAPKKSASSAKQKRAKSAPGAMEGAGPGEPKKEPDMLSPICMEHLYYTAHNVPTALELRGFTWDGAPKKKKGKKGKKKK